MNIYKCFVSSDLIIQNVFDILYVDRPVKHVTLSADFLIVFLGILESGSIRNAKSGMLREIGKGVAVYKRSLRNEFSTLHKKSEMRRDYGNRQRHPRLDYRPGVHRDRNHSKGNSDVPGYSPGQDNGSGWIATMR